MSSLSRLTVLALGATLAAGCGKDSTGPKAGSVTGVAGDNQSAPTGAALSTPVSFVILGGDGFPLNGAKVTWSVTPSAAATLDPKTQTTDGSGVASTNVTLGNVIGALTVTATVNGVSPVQFHITAVDPCSYAAVYSIGATVSGSLARSDCKLSGYFYDFYQLDLPTGQNSIRIGMTSTKFDAYVEFFRQAANQLQILGADDDIQQGVDQNSQLDIILGSGGTYVIGANSFDQDTVGAYTLTTSFRPTSITGCADLWITPGVTVIDTIRTTDCVNGASYFDRVTMFIPASSVIKIAERSTVFDPLLALELANFTTGNWDPVATTDDSAASNISAFTYTVAADALLRLTMGAAVVGQTGEYTLVFSGNTTGPTAAKAPSFLPLRSLKGWQGKH